jgi:hypothetical protein
MKCAIELCRRSKKKLPRAVKEIKRTVRRSCARDKCIGANGAVKEINAKVPKSCEGV